MTASSMDAFIRTVYHENFEMLRHEGGGSLSPDVRQAGLNQVLLYWRRLQEVAEHVTDTEVPIHLANQRSPEGRVFGIEGVVDIVQEEDRTIMYDIKTHDPDYVRTHTLLYQMQLNLYAYVWKQLRGQPLDQTAIIATTYPDSVKNAIPFGKTVDELSPEESSRLDRVLKEWQPLIDIPFHEEGVAETIRRFGEVVDKIENRNFSPPPLVQLKEKWQTSNQLFATRVCRNCDARFSCSSYRTYAEEASNHNWRLRDFTKFFYDDYGDGNEQDSWLAAGLTASPSDIYIDALLGE